MWKSKEAGVELSECFLIFLVYDFIFRNELCMTASNTKPSLLRPFLIPLTTNLNLLKAAIMCEEFFWLSSDPLCLLLLNMLLRVVLGF